MSDSNFASSEYAWLAAIISALLAWFARGFGFGREFGEIKAELRALSKQIDDLKTRVDTHFDRRD